MIFGPDLPTLKAAAKAAVMARYVGIAEADGVPPTLRALYVLKTAEARAIVSGGTSEYIEREAALRGVRAAALARQIVRLAAESEALELARMRANVAIEAATDEAGVHDVIDPLGVVVSLEA